MADYTYDAHMTLKSADEADGWGRFTGTASNADEDLQGDVIEAGAFGAIDERNVALLAFHQQAQALGRWENIRQEGQKLIARGALLLSLPRARETFDAIRHGVLNGLSVGFAIPDPAKNIAYDGAGRRRIRKAKLLEISICSVPANSSARISEVRSYYPGDPITLVTRMQARFAAQSAVIRSNLADLELRAAEAIAAAAMAGRLDMDKSKTLLRSLRDDMRSQIR